MKRFYAIFYSFSFFATPSLAACKIVYDPSQSRGDLVVYNVSMKAGQRCIIEGDEHMLRGEKTYLNRGTHGRMLLQLHKRGTSWLYVYKGPRNWEGKDRVGIFHSSPAVENRFDITVTRN